MSQVITYRNRDRRSKSRIVPQGHSHTLAEARITQVWAAAVASHVKEYTSKKLWYCEICPA